MQLSENEKKRLFVALKIPPEICDDLKSLAGMPETMRSVAAEKMHITLNFIGNQDRDTCRAIMDSLAEIKVERFFIQLRGIGCFGRGKRIAVWAGVEYSPELDKLKRQIDEALAMIIAPEKRPFSPHVTLARMRCDDRPGVRRFVDKNADSVNHGFEARMFTLFWSRPMPEGPVYSVLRDYPLAKQADKRQFS